MAVSSLSFSFSKVIFVTLYLVRCVKNVRSMNSQCNVNITIRFELSGEVCSPSKFVHISKWSGTPLAAWLSPSVKFEILNIGKPILPAYEIS